MSDFQNDPFGTLLSPDGEARRRQILRLAVQEAGMVRHRRIRRRVAIVCALALLAGIFIPHRRATQIVQKPAAHPFVTDPVISARNPKTSRQPREILITRIQTDPTIAARLALRPQKPTWQKIGDDALLERLTEAGKPAGLAYVDGRSIIMFRGKAHYDDARTHHLN
jgi:hypothetical protein